jgi:hypothetical protein
MDNTPYGVYEWIISQLSVAQCTTSGRNPTVVAIVAGALKTEHGLTYLLPAGTH